MRFTGFLTLLMRSWFSTIFPKRGCVLYTRLTSIHYFKGLKKGCVFYTVGSYTSEITVNVQKACHIESNHCSRVYDCLTTYQIWYLLAGVMRDATGTHTYSLRLFASTYLLSSLLWSFERFTDWRQRRRRRKATFTFEGQDDRQEESAPL